MCNSFKFYCLNISISIAEQITSMETVLGSPAYYC